MRDHPTVVDLLATARRTLMERLLPDLPAERRYGAHLIGAALAIAVRELEAGGDGEERERRALARLLDGDGGLEDLNRQLAAEIRAGRHDTDPAAVHRLLVAATRSKLLENNPAYLEPHDGSAAERHR